MLSHFQNHIWTFIHHTYMLDPKSILISSLKKMSFWHTKDLLYYFSTLFYNIPFIRYSILQFYTLESYLLHIKIIYLLKTLQYTITEPNGNHHQPRTNNHRYNHCHNNNLRYNHRHKLQPQSPDPPINSKCKNHHPKKKKKLKIFNKTPPYTAQPTTAIPKHSP